MVALIDAGADVNATTSRGSVLLWSLENNRHDGLTQRLLQAGAVLAPNERGPGLMGALFNGTPQQVRRALELGADANALSETLPGTCLRGGPGDLALPLLRAYQRVVAHDHPDDFEHVLVALLDHGLDLVNQVRTPAWQTVIDERSTQGAAMNAQRKRRQAVVARHLEALELRQIADQGAPDLTVRERSRL